MTSNKKPFLIVLGMHRSGTSLCAHLLTRLGYDMSDNPVPAESNAKGHWERMEFVARHDRILKHFDRGYYSTNHAFALPPGWWTEPEVQKVRRDIVSSLRSRVAAVPMFGIKDPRICLMLPMWKEVFAELDLQPRFVFCFRNPAQIVRSVVVRDKFDPRDTELRWVRYNAHAIAGVAGYDVTFIHYDQWFSEPSVNLNRLLTFLTSAWQPGDPSLQEAIGDIIAPELRHDGPGSPGMLLPFTRQLFDLLKAGAAEPGLSPELLVAARSFIAVEQLHAAKQVEFMALSREAAANKAAAEAQKTSAEELGKRIAALEKNLAEQKTARAKAEARLVALEAPLARAEGDREAADLPAAAAKPVAAKPARAHA